MNKPFFIFLCLHHSYVFVFIFLVWFKTDSCSNSSELAFLKLNYTILYSFFAQSFLKLIYTIILTTQSCQIINDTLRLQIGVNLFYTLLSSSCNNVPTLSSFTNWLNILGLNFFSVHDAHLNVYLSLFMNNKKLYVLVCWASVGQG